MNTTTKQAKDDPISNGYILVHNADRILREQIFTRRKALLDYGNDIAVAKSQGKSEGRIEGRNEGLIEGERIGLLKGALKNQKEMVEKMRKNGASEDLIHAVLGDDYENYALP